MSTQMFNYCSTSSSKDDGSKNDIMEKTGLFDAGQKDSHEVQDCF